MTTDGTPCTTIMGDGVHLTTREDGIAVVRLWALANNSKATLYTPSSKLVFGSSSSTPSLNQAAPASGEPSIIVATTAAPNPNDDSSSDNDDGNLKPNPFRILWPAYLCCFIDFLGAGIAIPILPYFALELAWDSNTTCPTCPQVPVPAANATFLCGEVIGCGTSIEVGLSISFFAFGQVIGNLIMSRLSDKLGRKIIIMISIIMSALGYVWCGLAQTLTSLLLARACSGIAGGTLPVVQAMVLDVVGDPRERPKFFGLASACLGLGFMVGPALGAGVNAAFGSKRAAFFSPAVVASLGLIVAFFKIKETKPGGGVFGQRDVVADEIFDQGKAMFGKEMERVARARSVSVDSSSGVPTLDAKQLHVAAAPPTLPTIVFYCAAAATSGAFIFTCMTSMTALVWLNLFNFGPTELGIFLTAIGFISIFMNVAGVKFMIRNYGSSTTILLAAVLLDVGIAGFTFIDIFWLHALYFIIFINVGWSLTLPTLLDIAGENVPPELRGKATGMIAGSMSLGFATCPLISGALFQSDVLSIQHEFGKFSHLIFLIGGLGVGCFQLFILLKGIVLPKMAIANAKLEKDKKRAAAKAKAKASKLSA